MRKLLLVTIAVAAIAVAPAAMAQTQGQAQTDGAPACELHFWPSSQAVTSTYSGVGGVVGAMLSGPRPQSQSGLISDLPPEAQAEALAQVDLGALLGMPNLRVVPELAPLAVRAGRRGPRLSSSTAPCYAELVVDFIGYRSHITAGRQFGARYWLRRYPDASGLAQVQNGGKDVRLHIYPARRPEDQPAALAELRAAFARTTEGFVRNKVHP
jgi:hypothetical protein